MQSHHGKFRLLMFQKIIANSVEVLITIWNQKTKPSLHRSLKVAVFSTSSISHQGRFFNVHSTNTWSSI